MPPRCDGCGAWTAVASPGCGRGYAAADHNPVTPVVGEAGPSPALTRNRRPCIEHGEPEHPPRRVPNTRCRGKQRVGPPDHRRLPAVAAGRKACLSIHRASVALALHRPGGLPGVAGQSAQAGRRLAELPAGHGGHLAGRPARPPDLIHNPNFGRVRRLRPHHRHRVRAPGDRWTHGPRSPRSRNALSQHVDDYTGDRSAAQTVYAGATAKLLVLAQATGGDPTDFGGVNLVTRARQAGSSTSGPAKGRIADQSTFGDFANTIGQILAVRGLTKAEQRRSGARPARSCSSSSAARATSDWTSRRRRRPTRPAARRARPTPTSRRSP